MSEIEKYESAAVVRGLRAKYASMERQHQGLIAMLADAQGDKKRTAELRKTLAENLERRKHYAKALSSRGFKVKDPFMRGTV